MFRCCGKFWNNYLFVLLQEIYHVVICVEDLLSYNTHGLIIPVVFRYLYHLLPKLIVMCFRDLDANRGVDFLFYFIFYQIYMMKLCVARILLLL